jgi:hypothetical protein
MPLVTEIIYININDIFQRISNNELFEICLEWLIKNPLGFYPSTFYCVAISGKITREAMPVRC